MVTTQSYERNKAVKQIFLTNDFSTVDSVQGSNIPFLRIHFEHVEN